MIRTATIADLDEITKLEAACFPEAEAASREAFASRLMRKFIEHAKMEGRMGVVLTCKEAKISFYEKFGFKDEGLSPSVHGGVPWNQMRLVF